MSVAPWSRRVYRLLLLVYPASHRERFGAAMCDAFDDAVRATKGPAAVGLWLRTFRDVVWHGLAERRSQRRPAGPLWNHFSSDLAFATRLFVRNRGLTAAAITALALGIGLTTTAFSIVYGTIIRGLPFDNPQELVHFERQNLAAQRPSMAVTPHDYDYWRRQQASFEDLGAYVEAVVDLSDGSGPAHRLTGVFINATSFTLLRVAPTLGRVFTEADEQPGGPNVIILSHAVWENQFGGSPDVIGQVIRANGAPSTVVGVMPLGFGFPISEQFWVPLRLDLAAVERGGGRLDVFGRLMSGTTLQQAVGEFKTITGQLAAAYPETNRGVEASLRTFRAEYIGDSFATLMYMMFAGAGIVLLIACVNVANLLLARSHARGREIAVRTAMGATRGRIISQLLIESLALATFGAILGIGVAHLGITWFEYAGSQAGVFRLPHGNSPLFWWDVRIDTVPLLFVIAVTLVTSLVAGILPALQSTGAHVTHVLKDEGRGSSSRRLMRWNRRLIVAELALTTGLLSTAGLMIKSMAQLATVDRAFTAEGIVTATVALPLAASGQSEARYPDHEARLRFAEEVLKELEAHPGVVTAAIATNLPTSGGQNTGIAFAGRAAPNQTEPPEIDVTTITPAYFDVFGVAMLDGRAFTPGDRAGAERVAIVDEEFVTRYFPTASPLFTQIRFGGAESSDPWVTIVGIAPTLWRDRDPSRQAPIVYVPLAQSATPDPNIRLGRWGLRWMDIALEVAGDPSLASGIPRTALLAVDRDVPAYGIRSMEQVVAQQTGRYRVYGTFYIAFGAIALLLSLIGLYGVMAFSVRSRTSEIGIRMALGAGRQRVSRAILRQGMSQIAVGIALGSGIAVWLSRGLNNVLYQVEPWDPMVYLGIVAALITTGLVACLVPASHAARIDPIRAVRNLD